MKLSTCFSGVTSGVFLFLVALVLMVGAHAQTWPVRPVSIVVPYPAGGNADAIARIMALKLQEQFKQPFIVDNRPGASGNIGARMVAKSKPDGYTLLVGGTNNFSSNQFLFTNLGYDLEKELTGIAVLERHPVVLLVPNALNIVDVRAFIAASVARPKTFSCGSPGQATLPHLALELFKSASRADVQHVPFKGSGALMPDLLGGRLECAFDGLPPHAENIKNGVYRALAVSTRERWSLAPEIPTFAEAGFPNIEATVWFALAAPSATSTSLLRTISEAVSKVLRDPDTVKRFARLGASVGTESFDETNAFFRGEAAKWRRVINSAKVTSE